MSSRTRRMQALRNLAERPGTEAEGKLARERLAAMEAEGKAKPDPMANSRRSTGVTAEDINRLFESLFGKGVL